MARSRVTELIQSFNALNEVERAVFLDQVDPQPEPEAPQVKRTRKKKADAPPTRVAPGLCSYKYPEGSVCLAPADNAIHDRSMGYAGYHPFQHSAPLAAPRSSRKSRSANADKSSTPSTETLTDSAGSAVQESHKSASAGD